MTTAEFVRLQQADLAQMDARVNSLLTPEGARAWYANDVARLLCEVSALALELHDVRQALAQELPEASDETRSLGMLIALWKEQASGAYEKAQLLQQRATIKEKARQIQNLETRLEAARALEGELVSTLESERAAWREDEKALRQIANDAVAAAARATAEAEQASVDLHLADLTIAAKEHDCAEKMMAAALEIEEVKAQTRAALQGLIESLS